jgi:hypothetical protein
MKKLHHKNQKLFIAFLCFSLLLSIRSLAQITGSLFMLPNNFYAQMYNPSYIRTDKAIEISVAGLGGFSFVNQGSFKISDFITTPFGSPVIDIENFNENINRNNFIRQDIAVPMAFVSIPSKKGVFSFYYKENFSSVLKFKKDVVEFFINGNTEQEYENFNSDAIKLLSTGYREFALGYAKSMNKKLDIGVHAKLLFGSVLIDADNWKFVIKTAPDGSAVNFIAEGYGHMMLPVPIVIRYDSTIFSVDTKNAVEKYLKEYQNPGIAFDLGATYQLNTHDKISVSLRDLGAIWYRHNSLTLNENEIYNFIGFDLVSAVRYADPGEEYDNPLYLSHEVRDSMRNVWHPKVLETGFAFGLAPKTILHYQHAFSDKYSLGITDQSAFQKNNFKNILTVSALQSWSNLSVFENANLHGVSDVTIGGGIQYEGNYAQFFLATDNLVAFYHPANNKTFSITAGICILLNHKKEVDPEKQNKGIKNRRGKISPELPYYKHLRK